MKSPNQIRHATKQKQWFVVERGENKRGQLNDHFGICAPFCYIESRVAMAEKLRMEKYNTFG
jgi:hypothetical protein